MDRLKLYEEFGISKHNPKNGRIRVCTVKKFRDLVRQNGLITTNNYNCGIPQGSPMSALLSNIYMLSFDEKMKVYAESFQGEYFRYCDDMLFIVPLDKRDEISQLAQEKIKDLKVTINPDKTELRDFKLIGNHLKSDKMLQYLGFMFDGENIYIRSSSLARYSEKMKRGVSLAKKTMQKRNSIRAYKGIPEEPLYMKKLYSRYTHLGGRNFITYGFRAAEKMNSKSIKKQLKPLWKRFNEEIYK